jgi:microcompartment protein CcmK/EutM
LSKARWDAAGEQSVQTKTQIVAVDRADLLRRLKPVLLKGVDALESDLTAFAVDLDGDGTNEIVFVASNLDRLADHDPTSKPVPYFVFAGVQSSTSNVPPELFYSDQGEYSGGTDALGDVEVKGLVSIAPETHEIALLVKTSPALVGSQMIVRYTQGRMQKLDTISFICN